MLVHRDVQAEDISEICRFAQSPEELYFAFPKAKFPLTFEQLESSIEQRLASTVVLEEGRVCGFANLYQMDPRGTIGIGNVLVSPDARGKGVGARLVGTMIRRALHELSARWVQIACFNGNVSGLLLYRKLGFEPYAIEPRLDQDGKRVALIRMRLCEAGTSAHLACPPG